LEKIKVFIFLPAIGKGNSLVQFIHAKSLCNHLTVNPDWSVQYFTASSILVGAEEERTKIDGQ